MIDRLLLGRLLAAGNIGHQWDPWGCGVDERLIRASGPSEVYRYETWRKEAAERHAARVRYFVRNPRRISPIKIDNVCNGPLVYPIPMIVDGWHRLLACRVLGRTHVRAFYSGRIDLLEYLKGTRGVLRQ